MLTKAAQSTVGQAFTLVYTVTSALSQETGLHLYGIRIAKLIGGQTVEAEDTGPVSASKADVTAICRTLAAHLVTPISLLCVVDQIFNMIF